MECGVSAESRMWRACHVQTINSKHVRIGSVRVTSSISKHAHFAVAKTSTGIMREAHKDRDDPDTVLSSAELSSSLPTVKPILCR